MKPLQPRERVLLWVVGLLVAVGVFYMFILVPRSAENGRLAQQLSTQQAELTRLRAEAQRKDVLAHQITDLQNGVQTLVAKLPSAREIPNLLVQLDALAHQSGVDLVSIRPSPLKPAALPGPAGQAAPRAGGGAAPGPQATGPQGGAANPAVAGLQQFTVELKTEGSFASTMKFVRGIETFPRFLAISDLQLGPAPPKKGQSAGQPSLALAVTTTAYVVPEEGGSP